MAVDERTAATIEEREASVGAETANAADAAGGAGNAPDPVGPAYADATVEVRKVATSLALKVAPL